MFYTFPPSIPAGSDFVKLILPLSIAVLGAVLFVLVTTALVWECCDGLWIQAREN